MSIRETAFSLVIKADLLTEIRRTFYIRYFLIDTKQENCYNMGNSTVNKAYSESDQKKVKECLKTPDV